MWFTTLKVWLTLYRAWFTLFDLVLNIPVWLLVREIATHITVHNNGSISLVLMLLSAQRSYFSDRLWTVLDVFKHTRICNFCCPVSWPWGSSQRRWDCETGHFYVGKWQTLFISLLWTLLGYIVAKAYSSQVSSPNQIFRGRPIFRQGRRARAKNLVSS